MRVPNYLDIKTLGLPALKGALLFEPPAQHVIKEQPWSL